MLDVGPRFFLAVEVFVEKVDVVFEVVELVARGANSFELLGLLNMAILTRALEDTGGDDSTDALVEALENFDGETIAGLAVEVTFGPEQRFASLQTAVYRADAAESAWTQVAGIAEAESLDE